MRQRWSNPLGIAVLTGMIIGVPGTTAAASIEAAGVRTPTGQHGAASEVSAIMGQMKAIAEELASLSESHTDLRQQLQAARSDLANLGPRPKDKKAQVQWNAQRAQLEQLIAQLEEQIARVIAQKGQLHQKLQKLNQKLHAAQAADRK